MIFEIFTDQLSGFIVSVALYNYIQKLFSKITLFQKNPITVLIKVIYSILILKIYIILDTFSYTLINFLLVCTCQRYFSEECIFLI